MRSFRVCWEMTINATGILVRCESNTIKMKKWNFTSLAPKVASIEIVSFCPHVSIDFNWVGVWIPKVNGAWIPPIFVTSYKKTHQPNDYMPKFESRWRGWHATTNFLPYVSGWYRWCHFVKWNHLSSWAPPHWPIPTKSPCVCHIYFTACLKLNWLQMWFLKTWDI